ncbi:putative MFS family arabinose efflux permease [Edaphobacter aggregans]|uniref:Putative MFS family arabinose efflux permease n=1 Tax=Edaphobacter aggregans TaxID=570835 RepID=A0A3R9R0N6_9BACT|nr:MFS transporter [Edaphobacter aggregans]RSL15112.1 putative MFS family arabinose efflux permease [Edaphobacter aggregans]
MQSSGSMRAQIGTLIIATSLIQFANGFFNTFISLRVASENFGATLAGLVLSSFFAGFTLGALRCAKIIERIGHIRAYAAFAGLVVAATAAMPLKIGPLPWLLLRGVIGFGSAGVFVTTESWLNAKAQPSERGRVFSIYMVGTFLALAVGQLLIARAELEGAAPFNAIVALFAVALIMVSATRAEPPLTAAAEKLTYGELARGAPVAVVGCVVNGLVTSAFYALVPAWMQDKGVDRGHIALFMLVAVVGGLAFQVPVGRISDRFDRRIVLSVLGLGFAGAAAALVLLPRSSPMILPTAAVLGGFMSTLYPVCVANAHDRMPADRVVAVSGQLILVSGLGSVLGPLIGTSLMARFDIDGVFYFMAAAALLLALVAASGSLMMRAPRHLRRPFEILTPLAAPLAQDSLGCSDDDPFSVDSIEVGSKEH